MGYGNNSTSKSETDGRWIDEDSPLAGVEETLRFLALGFSGGFKYVGIGLFLITPIVLGSGIGHTAGTAFGLTGASLALTTIVSAGIGVIFDVGALANWEDAE